MGGGGGGGGQGNVLHCHLLRRELSPHYEVGHGG